MKQIKTISIKCDCDKTIDFHELQSFQGGLKEHTESDYEKAKKSILQYGWSFVLYYWNDGKKKWIIDGHNRCEVLSRLEAEGYIIPPIPAIEVFCKNRKEAKQKLLRLNSTFGRLSKESVLEFAEDIDLNFDEIALPDGVIDFTDATEPQETEGDDEAPEVDEKSEPVSKRGEMYELGNSILMCGDSTNAEDVARLMGGVEADLLITDPPYNVNYEGGTKEKLKIENDNMDDARFRQFLIDSFQVFKDNMKSGASFYIWHADLQGYNFRGACQDVGFKIRECLIWNKNSLVLGRNDYQWKHEPCLYGWKDGGGHVFYNDRKQTTVMDFKRPTVNREHPTMKPVELFEYQIKNSTKGGDIVLDGFGGSGTTLIACEKNGRKARIMELDPKYCDVIRRRYTQWAKENGKPITSGCLE
jgi:site-specific DNA-methyltransferase (adenine-specific)